VPVVNPLTVTGLVAPVAPPSAPPFDETQVTVKFEIGAPLSAPGVNDTTSGPVAIVVAPGAALTLVGASGTPAGTKLFDAADGALVPTPFVAVAVQV